MQLIDSHAHIYLKEFKDDLSAIIDRAKESGVEAIYMPNIDHTSIDDMLEVAAKYPEYCIPMMGLHPCSVNKDFEKDLYEVEEWLGKGGFAAVGEIGTDLYWDKSFWEQQQEALKIQLEMAKKFELPFVIHCRESIDETIELLEPLNSNKLNGVFHCFTGTVEQAEEITAMRFKIGIGGFAGFNIGTLQKLKYKKDGKDVKDKLKGGYNTSDFVYGLSGYVAFGNVGVYAKYDLSPVFKDQAIEQNNISIGLRFDMD